MNPLFAGQLGGQQLDTYEDLRDFFERSGSPFWLQEWDWQVFDPDVHQQFVLKIDTPEDLTITHVFATGRMPAPDHRPNDFAIEIWKRGAELPALAEYDETLDKWLGPVYRNRPILAGQRFFWDSWQTGTPKDIAMPRGSLYYLTVRPRAKIEVKAQIGGFKSPT